jgi:3-hydroxyacyl-CoA dehydrogenase/enoyl-CoA hydratase/3-hydroxybutyryl-CoA epimerase/enoyl-CoA isomerase
MAERGWGTVVRFEELPDGIGLVTLDAPGKKVNTLGRAVLGELTALAAALASRTDLAGVLVTSGKPGQFVAGADLNELGALAVASRADVETIVEVGHEMCRAWSALPFPTVALVDGACMGGGTELILSLDERILGRAPHTSVGLPEVKIGIFPAWGGTQRLPRLVGLNHAIEMITSGEPVAPAKAVAIGLAFDAVPPETLQDEGRRLLAILRDGDLWRRRRAERAQPVPVSTDELRFTGAVTEGAVKSRTKGHYPAPLVALRAVLEGCTLPLDEGLAAERRAAPDVMGSPVAANLIGLFFARQRLARDSGVSDTAVEPRAVRTVGVIGGGQMGAGIAAAHARSGIAAALVDVDAERVAAGVGRIRQVIESRIAIGRATPAQLADMLSRVSAGSSWSLLADADVVVEAVTEDEGLKAKIFRELSALVRPDTILASNTSTISITRLASHVAAPERFVGMHFFHPVDRMELVEVIRGDRTDDVTVATIVALARRIRKTPIVVRDCAGFLVNRLLFPYMNEALTLLLEGVDPDELDAAATAFGMPMGPIALQDLVGLDTSLYAGRVMAAAYPDRADVPPVLEALVAQGRLGKKTGAGFRRFTGKKGRPEADPALADIVAPLRIAKRGSHSREEITDRLFLPMLLEAVRALEEGIVRDPVDADMGLILGIGFPPFRGGILRWCDTEGIDRVAARVAGLESCGGRFQPSELFLDTARRRGTFRGG